MKMRLLTRMLLYILLPVCVGFVTLSGVSDYLASAGMRKQINEDLRLLVSVQTRELDNILSILKSTAVNLSENAHAVEFLEGEATGQGDLKMLAAEAMQTLKDVVRNYPRVKDAGILVPSGKIALHTSSSVMGQDLSTRSYFKQSMQGETVVFTSYSDVAKEFVTLIAAPVKLNGKILGVALISLDINQLAATTTDLLKVSKTGFCFFLTPEGMVISHPDKSLVGVDQSNLPLVQTFMRGTKGEVVYDWNGMTKIAFYDRVPATNWIVALGVEEADLLTPISEMSKTTALLAVGITILAGGIIFFIARNIAGVLRGCAGLAQFVAAGNFQLSALYKAQLERDSGRSDEIGDLSKAMGAMISSLASMFDESARKTREAEEATQLAAEAQKKAEESARKAESARREGILAAAAELEDAVAVITSASTELSAQIEQSERGSAEQASRIAAAATAMEEMNSTVLEVAKNAGDASEASARTRQKAETGASVVLQAVQSIQAVHTQSVQLRADMIKLDENARAISQIMGVISDIADQTNLLALNAAIEAARAGEAGRGFAVVADEVRKLAEKTMVSTTDVGNAIRAIQQSASQSMAQVDKSAKTIEEATGFANQSGQALDEIVGMVDATADQVRSIATASEQQSATSEEINTSVAQVNSIASETARAMQESAKAVSDLAHQAQVLNSLIDNMKRS